jgi:L-glyceraldehyde 3-phosphate reductase
MYKAANTRYDSMPYRTCGRSGLKLPAISLGLWHNFGDTTPMEQQRHMLRTAFDLGITHFDLANNYGPPYGAISSPTGMSSSSPAKPVGTCGPAPMARAVARANMCWPAWTKA